MTEDEPMDSLNYVIDKMHETKPVNLEDSIMREFILDIAWDKAGEEDPQFLAIDYACTIYAKMLAEDLKYNQPLEVHYTEDSVRIIRKQ